MTADEERYERLLREFSTFVVQSQEHRARTESALSEMKDHLNTYWQATAKGMRQLADWFADAEDEARRERRTERWIRRVGEGVIIALLLLLIGLLLARGVLL